MRIEKQVRQQPYGLSLASPMVCIGQAELEGAAAIRWINKVFAEVV